MLVGIIGLGLIGGSFSKAYSKAGQKVLAFDTDSSVMQFAKLNGSIEGELTDKEIPLCDLILICTYPEAAVDYMTQKSPIFGTKPIVIDCCGTKRVIVEKGMALAKEHGFTYVGGHPMAGTQFSGYKYSKADLFSGAPMVIVPPKYDDVLLYDKIKTLLSPAGFGSITVTTAEKHDETIAFTSQLAHVVSNAYIKSPTARKHPGLSAGSYKDMTRVAWLNPEMWTQLFLDNRDNLIRETDTIIRNLEAYRKALEDNDRETLMQLLAEGRALKEEIDG